MMAALSLNQSGLRILGLLLAGTVLASPVSAQTPPSDSPQPADVGTPPAAPEPAAVPAPVAAPPASPAGPVLSGHAIRAQSGLRLPKPKPKPAPAHKQTKASPYHGMKESDKAKSYYAGMWGIDRLRVNYTSSGNLIRFSYRILEPKLATQLGDHQAAPHLFAPRTNAMLQVPTMEKIGQLRQLGAVEANKDYWMVFSNKGNLVRPGERVDVIIGNFHADGLLVE